MQHGKTYANLTADDDVLSIGLNRAVTLIEEKKAKGPRKGRFGADPGRALGDHPDKGGPVVVKSGRYGPYVSHDGVNATLPSDMTPETVTLEQAIGLLDARAARGGGGKKPPPASRAARPRKAPAKPKAERRRGPSHPSARRRSPRAKPRPPASDAPRRNLSALTYMIVQASFARGFSFVKRPHYQTSPPLQRRLLAFIGKQSGKVGTREIARAFGMKNADRVALKRMLRELADEGQVERRRKKLHRAGQRCRMWCSPTSPRATATAS